MDSDVAESQRRESELQQDKGRLQAEVDWYSWGQNAGAGDDPGDQYVFRGVRAVALAVPAGRWGRSR